MSDEELRELDAWIADRIMGLVEKPVGECTVANEDFCVHDRVLIYQGEKKCLSSFQPSTDPAAALLVLEKCITEAPMEIQIDRKRSKDGPFRIECGVGATLKLAIADTLPLAICLFAKQLFSS